VRPKLLHPLADSVLGIPRSSRALEAGGEPGPAGASGAMVALASASQQLTNQRPPSATVICIHTNRTIAGELLE
jgi:hypothetical protein